MVIYQANNSLHWSSPVHSYSLFDKLFNVINKFYLFLFNLSSNDWKLREHPILFVATQSQSPKVFQSRRHMSTPSISLKNTTPTISWFRSPKTVACCCLDRWLWPFLLWHYIYLGLHTPLRAFDQLHHPSWSLIFWKPTL